MNNRQQMSISWSVYLVAWNADSGITAKEVHMRQAESIWDMMMKGTSFHKPPCNSRISVQALSNMNLI